MTREKRKPRILAKGWWCPVVEALYMHVPNKVSECGHKCIRVKIVAVEGK